MTKPFDIVSKGGAPISVRQTSRIFRYPIPEIGMKFGEPVFSSASQSRPKLRTGISVALRRVRILKLDRESASSDQGLTIVHVLLYVSIYQ
jgi:predicted PP-loop superfamily ATPase